MRSCCSRPPAGCDGREKDVRRGPQVQSKLIHRIRLHKIRHLRRIAVARTENTLGQDDGTTVRVDVHELAGEVRITRRRPRTGVIRPDRSLPAARSSTGVLYTSTSSRISMGRWSRGPTALAPGRSTWPPRVGTGRSGLYTNTSAGSSLGDEQARRHPV